MVRSLPSRAIFGLADGHSVFFARQLFLDAPVEAFVLEENHRVVIADGRFDQPLGIVRRRRRHHFQTGRAHEPHLRVLRVKRAAVNAAARRRAHHDRHGRVPAIAALGGEVDNLVEAAGDEIGELHLRHRPQPHEAGADGRADDGAFGNGRIHHAFLAEMLEESGGHFERAAVDADVFAQQEDVRVALHLFPQPLADGFQVSCRHGLWVFVDAVEQRRGVGEAGCAPPRRRPRRFRRECARGWRRSRPDRPNSSVEHSGFEPHDRVELAPLLEQASAERNAPHRAPSGPSCGRSCIRAGMGRCRRARAPAPARWRRGPPARRCHPRFRPACCRPGRDRPHWRKPSAD